MCSLDGSYILLFLIKNLYIFIVIKKLKCNLFGNLLNCLQGNNML